MDNLKKLLMAMAVIPASVHAGMTVSVYEQEKNTEEIKIYISGLANGFAFSNTELQANKKAALFCQPNNLLIKTETYLQLLDQKISTYPKDKVGRLQIEPLLLSKLIEVYPCK